MDGNGTLKGLILDEDYGRARIVRQIVEDQGHGEAVLAKTASDALSALQNGVFTFAIVDLTSESAVRQADAFMAGLRRPEGSPSIGLPVLAVTTGATEAILRNAVKMGADLVIKRPFSARDLLERINHMLTKPAPHFQSANYFGPDRRRMPRTAYDGPLRRGEDGSNC